MQIRGSYKKSQLKMIGSGILIGIAAGTVVASFRYLIEHLTSLFIWIFAQGKTDFLWFGLGLIMLIAICLVNGWFLKTNPEIKGSGIPQVEGQLIGLFDYAFWPALWRKFVGGVLAIGSGLFLGREGPSIQLGSTIGQGISKLTKQVGTDRNVLISSGAAAGLSAAFNAPIASTMFVLEEVYHNFSTNIWMVSLTASISSDCIATYVFGLKPVLFMKSTSLPLKYFVWIIPFAILLGIFGRVYQLMTLNISKLYSRIKFIPKEFSSIFSFLLIIPIAMYLPQLMGGGSRLILSLQYLKYPAVILIAFFGLRLLLSVFTYGSGLPGGIFLPMLCLGALLGATYGSVLISMGLVSKLYFATFVIMGMAGYFACVSKAPFTAILLITEMVGTLSHLLGLALVSLLAYLVVDILNGKPIYHSLLLQMLGKREERESITAFETIQTVFVGALADGKTVKQLSWPSGSLLIKIKREGREIVPSGETGIRAGDILIISVTGKKRQQIIHQVQTLTREN
ncbi:ClC family H(+)/Cl(-) exchange transporter [Lentilactobacillus curieae]|nr:ClC family H(+)/Cl(-) exchange transporter [Lentilactobacillus curieae]